MSRRPIVHRSTPEDQVGEDAEERKQNDKEDPEHLGRPAEIMTAEYVSEYRNGKPDPQEEHDELEHGPKDVDEGIAGSEHM